MLDRLASYRERRQRRVQTSVAAEPAPTSSTGPGAVRTPRVIPFRAPSPPVPEPIADPVTHGRPPAPRISPTVESATIREIQFTPILPALEHLPPLIPQPEPALADPVGRPAPYAPPLLVREPTALEIPLPAPAPIESAPALAPLALAPREQRLAAGFLDAAAVAGATLAFAASAWAGLGFAAPDLSHWKALLPAAVAIPASLAAVYTLASFYLGSATPGMRILGLELRAMGAAPITPALVRRRAWLSLLSLGALGLGYAWALIGGDGLSWHDSIAGTFVASRPSPRPPDRREPDPEPAVHAGTLEPA